MIQSKWLFVLAFATAGAAVPVFAQDQNPPAAPPSPGWHKFGQSQTRPVDLPPPAPPSSTLAAGSWITIRVNQPLSSDHNKPGDAFTGTLVQPIVVNGLVI